MIVDERYATFIHSMDSPHTPFLEELYLRAVGQKVPVIRRQTQSFLKTFLAIASPVRILEVGVGVGFSSIFMAQYTEKACRITTIENYEKRIAQAEENIRESGFADRIELINGDAADVLPTLTGKYDLVFMDAAKAQYIFFLDHIRKLVQKGSVIISDNVLQDGNIIESRYMVERRDRTIYKRMREYLYTLTHDGGLSTTILPIGDGIALTAVV